MKSPIDLVFIGSNAERELIDRIAVEFNYTHAFIGDVDGILSTTLEPQLVLVSEMSSGEIGVDELIQVSRQQFPDAFLILFIEKELSSERFQFISKLGADVVMLRSELPNAKVSFAINQILRASLLPLKSDDLVPDQVLPFTLYHLMPQRKKFLPLIKEGNLLPKERHTRLSANAEFYYSRHHAIHYKKYIETFADKTPKGLAKRCRANFSALQAEFSKLAFEISDQSNRVSFGHGQELLSRCEGLCTDLLNNLAEYPEAWKIINNSSIGEFGSLERAPAVAAYSGIFSLLMDQKKVSELMLLSLLVDVGVLSLPETVAQKLRKFQLPEGQELQDYKKVPLKSLDMIFSRKLSLAEKLRFILVTVYEKADGTGYPAGVNDQKISIEAQIIRLAKEFDEKTVLKLGRATADPKTALSDILADPKLAGTFSAAFREMIQNRLVPHF